MKMRWTEEKVKRYPVLASALSFLLLTVAIISVYNDPMQGYEYSVYQSTPFIFWIAILLGLITGIFLFVVNYGKRNALWALGLFQIILFNFVFVTLYLYRSFIYLERFDSQTYVGYARDVFIYGHIPAMNFYPMGSLLMAQSADLLGQSVLMMSQLFPGVFLAAYTLGLLCWSRRFSNEPQFITSMMLAGMPIFFAWFVPTIFHESLCVLILPVFYTILWRGDSGDKRYKILTAMFLAFLTLGHPLVAIGVLLFMAIIFFIEHITKREKRTTSVPMFLFGVVILIGWMAQNADMVSSTQQVLDQLFGLIAGASTLQSAQGMASSLGLLTILQSVLVMTMDDFLYILLTLVLGIFILRSNWRTHPMSTVMACFLGGTVFLAILIFFTAAHNPFRMINLNFIMIFTIPMIGYILYRFRTTGRVMLTRLLTLVIVLCMVSTVFTLYEDPIAVSPNISIARSEIVGSNWFINEKGEEITIYALQTNPLRFASLIYGWIYVQENPVFFWIKDTTSHFESFYKGENSSETTYLFFSSYDYMGYTRAWAAANKFNVQDFRSLNLVDNVTHIYTNGCLTVYAKS